jgi:hypothetical protein
MIKNKPWQFCVMRMRHQLAQASRDLISREYPDGIFVQELDVETKLEVEKYPWFQYTMAGTDEEFLNLVNGSSQKTSDKLITSIEHWWKLVHSIPNIK